MIGAEKLNSMTAVIAFAVVSSAPKVRLLHNARTIKEGAVY